MKEILKDYINTAEAARLLGYVPATLVSWRNSGKGPPYYRIGNRIYYRKDELLSWKEENLKPIKVDPQEELQETLRKLLKGGQSHEG